jgi:hypothetical protein
VYGHFTAKLAQVLGIALLTGHELFAVLFSFQPHYAVTNITVFSSASHGLMLNEIVQPLC